MKFARVCVCVCECVLWCVVCVSCRVVLRCKLYAIVIAYTPRSSSEAPARRERPWRAPESSSEAPAKRQISGRREAPGEARGAGGREALGARAGGARRQGGRR